MVSQHKLFTNGSAARWLSQCFLLLGLWLVGVAAAWAEVTASLSDNPVVRGQTVTLTIRVSGEKGEPDLSVLGPEFKIISQNTSSQVQYINGEMNRWKDWHIQLLPSQLGQLTIPAIPVGRSKTQPLSLQVVKQPAGRSQEAWIQFSAEPTEAWQGQQVLLTAELYYQSTVRTGELSPPSASNAVIEQLGDDVTEQLIKNEVRYNRLTRQFLLFPEQAGELRIAAPVFTGQANAAQQSSRSFGGLFRSTRAVSAAADDLLINVLAPPASAQGFWLPAQDLSLSAEWADGVTEFRVGEPVTRVVSLRAFGLLATQLPELSFDFAGLRAYPEEAEQETRANANGVIGIRHYRTALIPQQPGRYVLPAVELPWFDVTRGEMRVAYLPEEAIEVQPSLAAPAATTTMPAPVAECPEVAPQPTCDSSTEVATDAFGQSHSAFWPWLSLLLGIAWLLSMVVIGWLWRQRSAQPSQPAAADQVSPKLAELKKRLIQACRSHDSGDAVKQLAHVAAVAQLGVTSPAALANSLQEGPLKQALLQLDAAHYGGVTSAWRGDDLAAALMASPWPELESVSGPSSALPSLYPE